MQGIYWFGRGAKSARRILPDLSRALLDERGYLLWVREGTLVAQRFDPERGELSGGLIPVAEGVGVDPQRASASWFAASASGTVAFRQGIEQRNELVWTDRKGTVLGSLARPGDYREPSISADGRMVVVANSPGAEISQLWVYETSGTDRGRRLTFDAGGGETAVFSPDGRWVAYSSARANGFTLFRKPADGSGEEESLFEAGGGSWVDSWSPDGRHLLFERFVPERGSDLWILPLDGTRKAVPFLETPANETHASFSPDGRLVAYVSDEGGMPQIFVRTFPASGSRWQVSRNGGDWPAWSADGKELYLRRSRQGAAVRSDRRHLAVLLRRARAALPHARSAARHHLEPDLLRAGARRPPFPREPARRNLGRKPDRGTDELESPEGPAVRVSAGTRLGAYEVVSHLGEGGMGEVWRARDTKLGREVALKLLPPAFASDPDRLSRFEREAKLLASLNHSAIAHLYGFEGATLGDGSAAHVLVMELAEGEDLAQRMKRGPIPFDEALPVARQIAEALEEAHEKGVVHRDLKPQNVKLSSEGKVKVLDFGLAKAMDTPGATSAADLGHSPTLMNSPTMTAAHGTQLGVILGTAAYMSPEQARGGAVDKRADVWAFGVVLFEMLSGRSLFAADTVSDTLAGVLKTEVDFGTLPATTPPALRQLLRRCLERSPKNRLHDIADARIVIDELIAGRHGDDPKAPVPAPARRTAASTAAWVAALLVASAAAAFAGYRASVRGTAPPEPLRLSIQLGAEQEIVVGANSTLAFSPDGGSLVFAGRSGGRQTLFRRALGGREAVAIPGTDGADGPFLSPDGKWIGFVSGGNLMKVAAEGGRPFRIADWRGSSGAAWLSDGTIVFAPSYSDGLYRGPAAGGASERLTTPDSAGGELGHWWPDVLPGERHVVFTAFRTPVDKSRIGVLDLTTREVKWVVEGGFFARWVPTGHLLYALGQRLYALPFDPAKGVATGPAVAVVDDVLVSQTGGFAMAAVSSRGTLAFVSESLGNPLREVVWLDRTGQATPAIGEKRRYLSASLSPDGRHVALTIQGESRDLWTWSTRAPHPLAAHDRRGDRVRSRLLARRPRALLRLRPPAFRPLPDPGRVARLRTAGLGRAREGRHARHLRLPRRPHSRLHRHGDPDRPRPPHPADRRQLAVAPAPRDPRERARRPRSLPTGAGSPTSRTRPGGPRSTPSPSPARARGSSSRPTAAPTRSGQATARSSTCGTTSCASSRPGSEAAPSSTLPGPSSASRSSPAPTTTPRPTTSRPTAGASWR